MTTQSNALVTGGSRGLGLALCKQLAQEGFKVWMACRDTAAGRSLAQRLPGEVAVVEMDVTVPDSVKKALQVVALADDKLDLLINNAGIYPSGDEYPQTQPESLLMDTLAVNVGGAHSVIQAAFPWLQLGQNPAVVNVSSGYGSLALNAVQHMDALCYCTSKAALNMLSLQWSSVLTPLGIHICMPSPGWMRTSMGRADGKSPEQGAAIVLEAARLCRQGRLNKAYIGENGPIPW